MIGQRVVHSSFGQGLIVKIIERPIDIPLIHVRFDGSETPLEFNADSFESDVFTEIEIPSSFDDLFPAWEVDWERKQLLKRQREEAFQMQQETFRKMKEEGLLLARRYKVSIEELVTRLGPSPLFQILEEVEKRQELSEEQIHRLERQGYHRVLATYYYRRFGKNKYVWDLVNACTHLRRAKMPREAVEIFERARSNLGSNKKARSALFTTLGGSHRDLGDLDEAVSHAAEAIRLWPDSQHAHTLMGAILYEQGDFPGGDWHFERARELGSMPRDQDREIRRVWEVTSAENQNAIAEHLLAKDPARYSWTIFPENDSADHETEDSES